MRGRKPKQESRAAEIRAKLAMWKQTPEGVRPSLRALASELGTSHQLLSHYLQRWDRWEANEYQREAEEIRARAHAENRRLTAWEEHRVDFCADQALRWTFSAALNDEYRKLRREAKRGQLPAGAVKMLTYFARRGDQRAQEILEGCSRNCAQNEQNNLPLPRPRVAKSFRSEQVVAGNSSKARRAGFTKVEIITQK
jgi:hypothetical protein